MNEIQKAITVQASQGNAFEKFVNNINAWWPKEYTWSQDKLVEMRIEPKKNGGCIEIGPHGFRCDWGRITELKHSEKIAFKWQISPRREPVPDPEKASDVQVRFIKVSDTKTKIEFAHFNFANHGEGAENYRKAMDSEYGWEYILNCFKEFCKNN